MTSIRADLVGVLVFRRVPGRGHESVQFLQLLRAPEGGEGRGAIAPGTWQPVMGAIEPGETAARAAARELDEEVGLRPGDAAWAGFWSLARVRPFFLAAQDAVCLMPMFAAEVTHSWRPTLDAAHTDHRWVNWPDVPDRFVWPDQVEACAEVVERLLRPGAACEPMLRIYWEDAGGSHQRG